MPRPWTPVAVAALMTAALVVTAACKPEDRPASVGAPTVSATADLSASPTSSATAGPSASPSPTASASRTATPTRRPATSSPKPLVCKPRIDVADGPDGFLEYVVVVNDAMWRSSACAKTQIVVWRVNYHINPDHTGTKELAMKYALSHANPRVQFKGDGLFGGICYSYHVVGFVSSVPTTITAAQLDNNKSYDYWRSRGGDMMWQEASLGGCPGHNP